LPVVVCKLLEGLEGLVLQILLIDYSDLLRAVDSSEEVIAGSEVCEELSHECPSSEMVCKVVIEPLLCGAELEDVPPAEKGLEELELAVFSCLVALNPVV
jgi:hypothetical protein